MAPAIAPKSPIMQPTILLVDDTKENLAVIRKHLNGFTFLNLKAGLRSVRGDIFKLAELLVRFGRDHKGDVGKLTSELRQGNKGEALIVAHTLKGLAGMLGLDDLQKLAQDTESAIKFDADGSDLRGSLNQLQTTLAQACEGALSLIQDLPEDVPWTGSLLTPPPDFNEKLQELKRQLASDDLDAAETHQKLAHFISRLYPNQADALRQSIDAFNFSEATLLLDEILKS